MKNKGFKIFLLIMLLAVIAGGLYVIASNLFRAVLPEETEEGVSARTTAETTVRTTEEITETEKEASVTDGFYYRQLGSSEQHVYEALAEGCGRYAEKIDVDVPLDTLYLAAFALINDHPEFFWADRYSVAYSGDTAVAVEYEIPEDARAVSKQMQRTAERILGSVPSGAGQYETVKYFYEWIIDNTDYGYSENDQNIRSVFMDGVSVCAGYSKAFLYLCNMADIECAYVRGLARSSNHAWNLVNIDGYYYWVDVTWGDPVFIETENMSDMNDNMNYNYLCVTDDELFRNHTVDLTLSSQGDIDYDSVFSFPECTDTSLNYYRLLGVYFDEYYPEELQSYIARHLAEGQNENIEIMFSNEEQFRAAYTDMFESDDSLITHAIEEGLPDFFGSYYCEYSSNDDLYYIAVSVYTE